MESLLDVSENNVNFLQSGRCTIHIPSFEIYEPEIWTISKAVPVTEDEDYDEEDGIVGILVNTKPVNNIFCKFKLYGDNTISQTYFIKKQKSTLIIDSYLYEKKYPADFIQTIKLDCQEWKNARNLAVEATLRGTPAQKKVLGNLGLNKTIQSFLGGKSRRKKRSRKRKSRKSRK